MLGRILVAAALGLAASAAAADGLVDRLYYGVSLTHARYSDDRLDETGGLTGGRAMLGLELLGPISLETRLGTTGYDDIAGVDVRIEYYGSAFLRLELGERARLYALAGGTYGKLYARDVRLDDLGVDDEDTDVSWGLGLELYGNASTAVAVEWIRQFDADDYYIDAANIGFTHRF